MTDFSQKQFVDLGQTLYTEWFKTATGLGTATEKERREVFKFSAQTAFEAAEEFSKVFRNQEETEMTLTPTQTTITKEQLDSLWNYLEYTRATISGGTISSGKDIMEKLDCIAIHKGRAYQSETFLRAAIHLVNQLKRELQ